MPAESDPDIEAETEEYVRNRISDALSCALTTFRGPTAAARGLVRDAIVSRLTTMEKEGIIGVR